jgi:hypothetical protein
MRDIAGIVACRGDTASHPRLCAMANPQRLEFDGRRGT